MGVQAPHRPTRQTHGSESLVCKKRGEFREGNCLKIEGEKNELDWGTFLLHNWTGVKWKYSMMIIWGKELRAPTRTPGSNGRIRRNTIGGLVDTLGVEPTKQNIHRDIVRNQSSMDEGDPSRVGIMWEFRSRRW